MQFEQIQFGRESQVDFHIRIGNGGIDENKLILALPPGEQNHLEASVYEIWLDDFQAAGWSTIIPVAMGEKLFWQGSERAIPNIVEHFEMQNNLSMAKFHLLGISNGGISSFRVATLDARRFTSITVIPGWPKPADQIRLEALKDVPVHFIVGQEDPRWLAKAEEFCKMIGDLGGKAELEIVAGQGHRVFEAFSGQDILARMRR